MTYMYGQEVGERMEEDARRARRAKLWEAIKDLPEECFEEIPGLGEARRYATPPQKYDPGEYAQMRGCLQAITPARAEFIANPGSLFPPPRILGWI